MENEKIREIIIKCIGNNDSYWIQPIEEIVNKIIELPDGAENSVANLLSNVKDYTSKQLFDIQKCVVEVCNELNIELDYSKNQGKVLGLPYNLSFIKKEVNISNNDYEFYKQNETDTIWWIKNKDKVGEHLFTFDKNKIFNLFRDYPYKLTKEEKEIFDKENPYWTDFFKDRNKFE